MGQSSLIDHFVVLVAAFILDSIWAFYIIETANKNPFKAALWGAAIMAIGAFLTLSYVEDGSRLISAIIGGMIGTYVSVKYSKK